MSVRWPINSCIRLTAGLYLAVCLALVPKLGPAQTPSQGTLLLDNPPVWQSPNGSGLIASPIAILVNGSGQAIGNFSHYQTGTFLGSRGIRWEYGSGNAYELLDVNTNPYNGTYSSFAWSLNNNGQVAGSYTLIDTSSNNIGQQAARWDAGSTAPVNLGHLSNAVAYSEALAISDSGIAGGYSYVGTSASTDFGTRAVRWDANSTTAVELGNLGTSATGYTHSRAVAINNAGTLVGYANTWDSSGLSNEHRAVRWDAGSTTAIQLAMPTSTATNIFSEAYGITDSGTVFGSFTEYFSDGRQNFQGIHWDAAGNYTLLESPHPPATVDYVYLQSISDMNESGTGVGSSSEFDTNGLNVRDHALKWAPGTATPTVLNPLSISDSGYHYSQALTINEAGTVGGASAKFEPGSAFGYWHAVVWLPGGTIMDLNDLPIQSILGGSGTWTLERVQSIAADGWATGYGHYDEDGAGTNFYPGSTQWVGQLGFGGVVVSGPGPTMRWSDGRNWSTGTPALEIGRAIFAHTGLRQMILDRIVRTQSVDVESGEMSLDVGGQYLTVDERIRIHAGARLNLRTIFDPANDLVGFVHGNILNEGIFSPGNSPGLLNLNGDFENDGTLLFEIEGSGDGQYDQLWVRGEFDAGGTLRLFLNGYSPILGDEFDLFDWGTLNWQGMLFDFSSAPLSSGLTWDTSSFQSSGILRISSVPEPAGFGLVIVLVAGMTSRRRPRSRSAN
ncbi:MAG: DUF3466 family protein [Pirellulaceae bacterium]